ncbi:hypothetical protein [Bacillus toyonensis]|uniref:hypothetical protein n=1 Tax=Bacillus toyonensis TaxID=155322 RepID=UPI001C3E9A34|nr:hypothetical protein [Bacillus toyonensis]
MDKQSKKENYLQKLLGKRTKEKSAEDASKNLENLSDLLEDLINVLPDGCFCPPSQATINNLSLALLSLSAWATFAPIPAALKLKLKAAIMKVLDEIHADPFSCCDTIKTLQALEVVLSTVVSTLPPGQQLHLLGLVQQLQALFAEYIACLACTPGPTGAQGPTWRPRTYWASRTYWGSRTYWRPRTYWGSRTYWSSRASRASRASRSHWRSRTYWASRASG